MYTEYTLRVHSCYVAMACRIGGPEAVNRPSKGSIPIYGIALSYAQCVREGCGLINSR